MGPIHPLVLVSRSQVQIQNGFTILRKSVGFLNTAKKNTGNDILESENMKNISWGEWHRAPGNRSSFLLQYTVIATLKMNRRTKRLDTGETVNL